MQESLLWKDGVLLTDSQVHDIVPGFADYSESRAEVSFPRLTAVPVIKTGRPPPVADTAFYPNVSARRTVFRYCKGVFANRDGVFPVRHAEAARSKSHYDSSAVPLPCRLRKKMLYNRRIHMYNTGK